MSTACWQASELSVCLDKALGTACVPASAPAAFRHPWGFRRSARQGSLGSSQQRQLRCSRGSGPAHAGSASDSGSNKRRIKDRLTQPLSPAEEQAVRQFWQSRGVVNKKHLQTYVTLAQRWSRHRDITFLHGYMARWDLVRQEFPDLDVDRVVRSNYLFIQHQSDAANYAATLRELYAATSSDVDWQKAANRHGIVLMQTAETSLQKLAVLEAVFSKYYSTSHRTGVSMQRIVQQAPGLLAMSSSTLPKQLECLLVHFQADVVAAIVTSAPQLLNSAAATLAADRDALQQLMHQRLPGADINILIRAQATLLHRAPAALEANLKDLACLQLPACEMNRLISYSPGILYVPTLAAKWARLGSLTAQCPNWQAEPDDWLRMQPTPSRLTNALGLSDAAVDRLEYLIQHDLGRDKSAYTWLRQTPAQFNHLHPDFATWQAARAVQHLAKQAGQQA